MKIAALGDAIMASTLIPAIRRQWPTATIGWLAGQSIAPIVQLFDGVDEVIVLDDQALLRKGRLKALSTIAGTWRALGRRWDRAIVAHTDRRYALLSAACGAHTSVRYADEFAPRKGRWHGSEYARLALGNPSAEVADAHYTALKTDRLPAPPILPGDGPVVVMVPGGARNVLRDDHLRRWPVDAWVAAAAELVTRGYRVVAAGAPSDHEECARVELAGALNLCGRTNLLQLAALLHRADVVVTHDSGPLHLSLALERPVVALFGPTSPLQFLPPHSRTTVLTRAHELPCAPCYDGRNFADCALNLCLTRVPVSEVVQAVTQFIEHTDHVHSAKVLL
ncbi:MAG: glycosyltransferase family 9 protein [Phycisphaerae bacterium]|nr:glycosyltransferase family 9 protein [Gemmatimonadaceae bacterium]